MHNPAYPTVLLTGFGPFPGVPVNISIQFAEKLASLGRENFAEIRFITAALPVVWRQAPQQLRHLYRTHRPMFAVHFGVSHIAKGLTIECVAKNQAACIDAHGQEPVSKILCPDGPTERMSTLPADLFAMRLREQSIPVVLSQDAGSYLCNAVLYHALELMDEMNLQGSCGFVHLPSELRLQDAELAEGQPHHIVPHQIVSQELSFETALEGGLELLTILLQQPGLKQENSQSHKPF